MQKRLDHPDHFHHNQRASVAALRSLIGIRRNADRLPSGTLIDFTRIHSRPEFWRTIGDWSRAGATELADAPDSKFGGRKAVKNASVE